MYFLSPVNPTVCFYVLVTRVINMDATLNRKIMKATVKESDGCARRKQFNKSTECTLGFHKCAVDQEPKLIESSYPDAISNCAELVGFSQISQVNLE